MSRDTHGICPHCQRQTGSVGAPCPEPECAKRGYSFVPVLAFDACKARASRKNIGIEPWIGRRIDRYLFVGKAGEGGMGAVYIGLQQPLNREVAVKVMPAIAHTKESLNRFVTEAKAVSALDHPNIVKLYDFGSGELDGQNVPYMVLEYIKHGRTLKNLMTQEISAHGMVRTEILLPIFEQILAGLGAAHAAGIVHRDVKPENVMLTQIHGNPYYVKILDFGLATGLESDNTGLTGSNQILGTPTYMAPEQIPSSRKHEIDSRTDLYAVGVILFEAMCGSRPFPGDTALAVLTAKANEKFNPFEAPAAASLTKAQRSFLEKAVSFNPKDRFQNSAEMLAALIEATNSSTTRKRGGILGFMEERLGTQIPGSSRGTQTSENTPRPGALYNSTATPNPLAGRASDLMHNPLAGQRGTVSSVSRNPLSGQTPATSPGIRRPPRTPTGPVASSQPGWASVTSEMRLSGTGPVSTMTPQQRAERLKGRKRRTTGSNMARAIDAERLAAVTTDSRNLKKGIPAASIFFGVVVVLILALVGVPRLLENKRQKQARIEMKDLRVALTLGGKFVGLDSAMLLPGSQTDHFVNNPEENERPLLDPWGNPYRVRYSIQDPTGYVLYTTGADGERGTCDNSPDNDDICIELGMP